MREVLDHLLALGFCPATVIDVGVALGTPALYTRFPHASHLLIEPLQEFEKDLKDICSQYDAEYILAAAGSRPSMREIAVRPNGGSSFLGTGGDIREVPAVILDDVCRERNSRGPYVVKVDVQGAELEVLDGAVAILQETELVILEVSFYHFVDGCPEFCDVVEYMKTRGFVAYDIFGGHNRPLDGARAQVDIAFAREDGTLRSSHTWATPEQTAELHAANGAK